MGLRGKLNWITSSFTLIAIIVITSILFLMINKNFFTLEERIVNDKIHSIENLIVNEFEEIEYILSDWAEWDLTYEYIQGLQPNYIDENFSDDLLVNLNLDYIFLLNEDNALLYGIMYSEEQQEQLTMNTDDITPFLYSNDTTGLLLYSGEIIMFSSMGITDNEANMPPKGQLVFAKRIDSDFLDQLDLQSDLSFDISLGDSQESSLSKVEGNDYNISYQYVHNKSQTSRIIIQIPFNNNSRYLKFETNIENSIQSLGKEFIQTVLTMIILIMIIFGILFNFSIDKLVIKRLLNLNHQIASIRDANDTKQRLAHLGLDEIGELSVNINLMLEEIDEAHAELSKFATFDEMTGVYNRRVGLDILSEVIRNFDSNNVPFSVIYLDIDGLKNVNDAFGHSVGDEMIKASIEIVLEKIEEPRYVVRLGGDEFLIILKNHSYDQALDVAETISKAISSYNKASEHLYTLSFSMGTVEYEKTMLLEGILETADKEMYQSKQKKKESILLHKSLDSL